MGLEYGYRCRENQVEMITIWYRIETMTVEDRIETMTVEYPAETMTVWCPFSLYISQ